MSLRSPPQCPHCGEVETIPVRVKGLENIGSEHYVLTLCHCLRKECDRWFVIRERC